MIEFVTGTINFQPVSDRGPDMGLSSVFQFSGPVNSAAVMLAGINYGYTDDEHWLYRTTFQLYISEISNDAVQVGANFGLRDNSGYWDDRYDAIISFVVMADVAAPSPTFSSSAEMFAKRTVLKSEQLKIQHSKA